MDTIILNNFLKEEINPNVIWTNLINAYLSGKCSKEKFIILVRNRGWVNKNIAFRDETYNQYLKTYTMTLMNGELHGKTIGILYSDLSTFCERLIKDYAEKLRALTTIMDMKMFTYKICTTSNQCNECDVIIPLTSFALKDADELDKNKLLFIGNNDYNIIKCTNRYKENYISIYNLIHAIRNVVRYKTSVEYDYYYIYIETI